MKAEELMIGDWVCDSVTNDPIQIDGACIKHAEYRENTAQGEVCNPIPLTEDVLKANGFVKNGGYDDYFLECDTHFVGYSLGGQTIKIMTHNFCCDVYYKCLYVHELQHILRLCGLNKLADNFKLKALEE